jgi:phospholipid N-methyltransferase
MFEGISTFLHGSVTSFKTTGAIAPSSQSLAKAITAEIARKQGPVAVLEVGAGTGSFSRRIVRLLSQDDRYDICELNPEFLEYLRKLTQKDPGFLEFRGRLEILPFPVQEIQRETRYDYIVSGLPLNGFSPEVVSEILGILVRLAKPGGWISYFEYIKIREMRAMCCRGEKKERVQELSRILEDFLDKYLDHTISVWANIPPAYARHCRIQGDKDGSSEK